MTKLYDINDDRKKAFGWMKKIGCLDRRLSIIFKSTGHNSMTKMDQGDYDKLFGYLKLIDKKEAPFDLLCEIGHSGSYCNPVRFDEKYINCVFAVRCKEKYFKDHQS